MKEPTPNPRPIERRLAPQFNALLNEHPPEPNHPRTQERAEALVADAVRWKASDIHLEPATTETRVRFRVDGVLHDVASLPDFSGQRLVAYFKTLSQIDATALARPEHGHGRMSAGGTVMELRTTVAPTPVGEMVGIRLLDTQRPRLRLDDIGMAETDQAHLRAWIESMQGMLLVCGPVGAGKTSTLYSMLHELQTQPRSIVTVEDPVESSLDGITQIEVNPKRGLLFPEAIRAMLRLDPDYLLVGEVRDPESAHVAVTAAGSGHALLSTIHSRDATGAVSALRNYGLKNWEISAALEVCVSQRLVRRLCPRCRNGYKPSAEESRWFAELCLPTPDELFGGKGCENCAGTGFDGRTGVFELWHLTTEAHHHITGGADDLTLARQALKDGLRPLLQDAITKTTTGVTSLSEIRSLASHSQRVAITASEP